MDTFARMRQLVGTTTEWAANDLVIGLGEIAVERTGSGEFRLKVGDGASRFSALPYASSSATAVAWDNITGRPTTFPPSTHNHPTSEVVGLTDSGGKLSLAVIPQTLLDRMNWQGLHTPTTGVPYPLNPTAGDTWGIAGPAFTFTTGPLAGKTVGEGSAITFDNNTWFMFGGGPGTNPADFVRKDELISTTTGPSDANKVPKTRSDGRIDPSFINVPGALNFRGTVDITQPPPVGVNQGDYWLVGIGGVAHAGWTGIAGTTLAVNDMVIWNGVVWTFTRSAGAASGFVPIDGSAPMTGPLSLPANPTPAAAHAMRRDDVEAKIAAIPNAITQIGFTPLNPANNLSELTNKATARSTLGLGTAATAAATDFLAKLSNLADLPDKGISRTNLGLGTAAVRPETYWLQTAQNLNDIPDKALARQNLGVPDLTDIILKSTVDAAGDLIVGTGPDTVARLPRGTAGQILTATAGSVAWAAGGAMSVYEEKKLAAANLELIVRLPAGARYVELQYELATNGAVNDLLALQLMVDATAIGGTNYFAQFVSGIASSVTATLSASTGYWSLGSATNWWGFVRGTLAPVFQSDRVYLNSQINGVGSQYSHNTALLQCITTRSAINGFRFSAVGGLAIGSTARVLVI